MPAICRRHNRSRISPWPCARSASRSTAGRCSEISFARVLGQLFGVAETFDMEVQPQLLLLQKNMLIAEGVSRRLNPRLNIWTLAQPLIEQWMRENRGPEARVDAGGGRGPVHACRRLPAVMRNIDRLVQSPGRRRPEARSRSLAGHQPPGQQLVALDHHRGAGRRPAVQRQRAEHLRPAGRAARHPARAQPSGAVGHSFLRHDRAKTRSSKFHCAARSITWITGSCPVMTEEMGHLAAGVIPH